MLTASPPGNAVFEGTAGRRRTDPSTPLPPRGANPSGIRSKGGRGTHRVFGPPHPHGGTPGAARPARSAVREPPRNTPARRSEDLHGSHGPTAESSRHPPKLCGQTTQSNGQSVVRPLKATVNRCIRALPERAATCFPVLPRFGYYPPTPAYFGPDLAILADSAAWQPKNRTDKRTSNQPAKRPRTMVISFLDPGPSSGS